MKMAKASKDDIQRCIKFFQLIDEYFEEGTYTPSDTDEPERLTDSDFVDRLREMWGGRLCRAGVDCSWMRVVFGCGILIDSVCDPAKDVLELRPDLASAAAAKAEVDRLRKLAKQFAETNTKLRRIACHVPVRVWMKASEECGYGNTVSINDQKIDEAWLEFTSVKPKEPTAAGQECDE